MSWGIPLLSPSDPADRQLAEYHQAVCVSERVSECVHVYTWPCMCVRKYVRVCVCHCVCVCVCVCVSVHVYSHEYITCTCIYGYLYRALTKATDPWPEAWRWAAVFASFLGSVAHNLGMYCTADTVHQLGIDLGWHVTYCEDCKH